MSKHLVPVHEGEITLVVRLGSKLEFEVLMELINEAEEDGEIENISIRQLT